MKMTIKNKVANISLLLLCLSFSLGGCNSNDEVAKVNLNIHFDDDIYGHWVINAEDTVKLRQFLYPDAERNWEKYKKAVARMELIVNQDTYQIIVNGKRGKKMTPEIIYSNAGLSVISDKELGIDKYFKKITPNKIRVEMGLNQIYVYDRKLVVKQ